MVSVADREGDIHEWFLDAAERAEEEQAAFVIRAKCNRRVAAQPQDTYLWEALGEAPVLGWTTVEVSEQAGRTARHARLTVRTRSVTLELIIGWYRARWGIELYFRILKQGCRIEKLRLETPERLERCLAVYMIIAWRLHYLTHAARVYPDAPCMKVFDVEQWQTIYLLQTHKRPPQKPPPLRTMTRMLAQLGGFLARKGDGEPGVETIWHGYMEMMRAVHTLAIAKAVGL